LNGVVQIEADAFLRVLSVATGVYDKDEGTGPNSRPAHRILDDDIHDPLGNYDVAYRNGLIDKDMAEDAFSSDLENALRDQTISDYLLLSQRQESDLYDGVPEFGGAWKLKFPMIVVARPGRRSADPWQERALIFRGERI
jgi:hypothetical protein